MTCTIYILAPEKKEALYKAVIASGKTIEEVLAAISDKQEEIA